MIKNRGRFFAYLVSLFLLSAFSAIYLVQMTGVTGISMQPELYSGQKVLINKFIYHHEAPERFDVIVFRYLYKENEYYAKRIIGLPGETVQIQNGLIYIDGKALGDLYGAEPVKEAGRAKNPVHLGSDEYFVLGDNRNYSSDSRDADVGNIKSAQILGKAFMKLWPLEKITQEGEEK